MMWNEGLVEEMGRIYKKGDAGYEAWLQLRDSWEEQERARKNARCVDELIIKLAAKLSVEGPCPEAIAEFLRGMSHNEVSCWRRREAGIDFWESQPWHPER
tara:strand:- start:250 stop:552 length:303 start_codon:yes stop_codon:yes gene_type:complete